MKNQLERELLLELGKLEVGAPAGGKVSPGLGTANPPGLTRKEASWGTCSQQLPVQEKQMISAHNLPKPCRGSTGWFAPLCFLLKRGRALGAGSCPAVLPHLLQHPLPAPAPTRIGPTEKAPDPIQLPAMPPSGKAWPHGAGCPPGTSRTLSLTMRARANSPASSGKDAGELGGVISGSWDFSPQPLQSWRVGSHHNCQVTDF